MSKRFILIILCLALISNMAADDILCEEVTSRCLMSNVGVEFATKCSEREPYFRCLRDRGCTRGMTIYEKEVIKRSYTQCRPNGVSGLVSWKLNVAIVIAGILVNLLDI